MPNPDSSSPDTEYLRRAIRIAMTARGQVEPNPMVGCVLVKDGRIIGEGCHGHYGGPHAEPTALANSTESPEGATAYVTLEPCCHTNKQTPPCAPRLIKEKIARVVLGTVDPNPDVDGKGIAMLRDAGIQVDTGILANECRQLLAAFIARMVHKRPYVTLKWAQSADGMIAGPGGRRVQISNARSAELVQTLRGRSDAVMVGVNTVLNDDPMLNARGPSPARQPARWVLDRQLRTPMDSRLVKTVDQSPVVIVTKTESRAGYAGVQFVAANTLGEVMTAAHDRRVAHVLVEPGPTLAEGVFEQNLCDRLWVFRSANDLGNGIAASEIPDAFVKTGELALDGDVLSEYLNRSSPVFFAAEPSADFVLASF